MLDGNEEMITWNNFIKLYVYNAIVYIFHMYSLFKLLYLYIEVYLETNL